MNHSKCRDRDSPVTTKHVYIPRPDSVVDDDQIGVEYLFGHQQSPSVLLEDIYLTRFHPNTMFRSAHWEATKLFLNRLERMLGPPRGAQLDLPLLIS